MVVVVVVACVHVRVRICVLACVRECDLYTHTFTHTHKHTHTQQTHTHSYKHTSPKHCQPRILRVNFFLLHLATGETLGQHSCSWRNERREQGEKRKQFNDDDDLKVSFF